MEASSCLTGSGFGPPMVIGAAEACASAEEASSDGGGVVEESDCESESLIEATPLDSVPVQNQLGRKRRERETNGSSESIASKAKRPTTLSNRVTIKSVPNPNNLQNLKFPTNATLQSSGRGFTILIKPQGPNAISFLKDPIGLAQGIKNSLFGAVKDLEVRPNPRRQLIALQSPSFTDENIANYLDVSMIGKWAVRCYQPGSDVRVHGVIGPVDPNVDVRDVVELASAGDFVISDIVRLTRFRNGNREPSATLKVTFQGQALPKKLKIGYVSYSVRPFVAPPMRCYRCQRLGHLAEGCNSPRRCLLCAGPHEHSVCTSVEKLCANCGGSHQANSLECPYITKLWL